MCGINCFVDIGGSRCECLLAQECFKSVFGLHSETGNIWTHLIGFIAFVTVTIVFYVKPLCDQCHTDLDLKEKLVFLYFFVGAILCLGLSSLFHTVCCHSEHVSKLFCKLDYVGISLLIVGSFIPWLYYGFYCQFVPKLVYMLSISLLGVTAIIVTMLDRFSTSAYRPVRAGLFVALGGFGFVPACHQLIVLGWENALVEAALHRVLIMGGLYILGRLNSTYATNYHEHLFITTPLLQARFCTAPGSPRGSCRASATSGSTPTRSSTCWWWPPPSSTCTGCRTWRCTG